MKIPLLILFTILAILHGSVSAQDNKTVLAHYMPWFGSKPVSGQWGWHWTMKNCDPEQMEAGKRNLASHYYPLIGPYDSNDPDALECHVLLMKFAGIDGVVIDWYGIEDHWDYAINHRNSLHLVKFLKKADLKFAVCYEDQTVKQLIEGKVIEKQDEISHGKQVLQWLSKNWFSDAAYVKLDGKPVMLVFGPQYFQKDQLKTITESVSPSPLLFSLPHLANESKADGAFGWPPVDSGKRVTPADWKAYLKLNYAKHKNNFQIIATAFPQFHDYYKQGEGRESIGSIEHRDGKTFDETLDLAFESRSELIQIATWNDFGEGTMIEPTQELGYRFLESVQSKVKHQAGKETDFTKNDLRLPVLLYQLRKKLVRDETATAQLEQASDLLFAGRCAEAKELLSAVARQTNN